MTCQAPVDLSLNNADSRKQDVDKWPWIIQMQNGCTATLIGRNHALTSSGCCPALDFKISGFTSDNRFVQERISIFVLLSSAKSLAQDGGEIECPINY